MSFRIESDGIGQVSISLLQPYGAQTQRALNLYPSNNSKTLGDYPSLVKGMLLIKAASASANLETGALDATLAMRIKAQCIDLIENYTPELFPVHAFHGGGGISTNMNINEVVANLVNNKHFQVDYGQYKPTHPNDDINLNHSTSDCVQSALHIAAREELLQFNSALNNLIERLSELAHRHTKDSKIARTCLQDAVTIGFSDYWNGIKGSLTKSQASLLSHTNELLTINLGGNVIGRSDDCDKSFFDECLSHVGELTGSEYHRHENLFQCSQSFDSLNNVVAYMTTIAGLLIKISKDMRLLASGPETGFGEISLPAVQPGSSALPGKINPTVPEYLAQCGMQALGHCHAAALTNQHGELDYNPWGMVLGTNLLDAITTLTDGVNTFSNSCVYGIKVNKKTAELNAEAFIPFAFELKKKVGYQKASNLIKTHGANKKSIEDATR